MAKAEASDAIKSADRVLDLLEVLGEHGEGLSHAELSRRLDIPKSSLTQLLRRLVTRGYARLDPGSRRYQRGPRLEAMTADGGIAALAAAAGPVLARITAATRESTALNVREGWMSRVIACTGGPQRLVTQMRLGDAAPLHATSGGKVLLAALSDADVERYLAAVSLDPITPATIVAADALRREVDAVRRRGFGRSRDEYTPGITGLAIAVAEASGRVRAAVNVAMPSLRFGPECEEAVLAELAKAAAEIAGAL